MATKILSVCIFIFEYPKPISMRLNENLLHLGSGLVISKNISVLTVKTTACEEEIITWNILLFYCMTIALYRLNSLNV